MLPEEYIAVVAAERAALWELADQARHDAKAADAPALRALADRLRRAIAAADVRAGGHLTVQLSDLDEALGECYDEVFPLTDPTDPADVLDAPWATPARRRALAALPAVSGDARPGPPSPAGQPITVGGVRLVLAPMVGPRREHIPPDLTPLAEQAIAAGDVRLLRLLLLTPLGRLRRELAAELIDALHAARALDTEVVEHAFTTDILLGRALLGVSRRDQLENDPGRTTPVSTCLDAARPYVDELLWRLTDPGRPADWDDLPRVPMPRGLRFVLRALDWTGDERIAAHLGAADLNPTGLAKLAEHLRGRTAAERDRVYGWRRAAGDAHTLLEPMGLAAASRLEQLLRRPRLAEVVRHDLAEIRAAADEAGPEATEVLLKLCPSEIVSAALGVNRSAVLRRVKSNALLGIAAYGLLPLADGETPLQRFIALREIARRGPKLGPNRRHTHAAAVAVAVEHLAQVAGYADAARFGWDCEAALVEQAPPPWRVDDYEVAVELDGAEPVIAVTRAGKRLKTVPAVVRAHPDYLVTREHQELLRDQARRMRTGLVEKLVATAGALAPDELAGLLRLPAGAAMLPGLLWQDQAGTIGLLDDLDRTGPLTAVHPWLLFERDLLGHWQAEIVRRRLRQPVKQVFRELYVLTPAERDAGDVSRRFAGHVVDGKVAAQLLSTRGWRLHDDYATHQATRPAGDHTAALDAEFHGYWGMDQAVVGELRLLSGRQPVPLAEVPPVVFSEVMRDLDLTVSVAGTDPGGYHAPAQADSRAQLLAALIGELGLPRVTVEGTAAVVRGSRATYRVHLNSGSIHLDPGGYLCVVPASFGAAAHRRLFLPFADEDRMTSVVLSKVLLLNEDEKITDPSILAQLSRSSR